MAYKYVGKALILFQQILNDVELPYLIFLFGFQNIKYIWFGRFAAYRNCLCYVLCNGPVCWVLPLMALYIQLYFFNNISFYIRQLIVRISKFHLQKSSYA